MATEPDREQFIQDIAGMLRSTPFTFEFKVKKNPNGIKIVYEVTQEELEAVLAKAEDKQNKGDSLWQ